MDQRVSLITLGVSDLARATRFYEECLGLPKIESSPGIAFFELGKVFYLQGRNRLSDKQLSYQV